MKKGYLFLVSCGDENVRIIIYLRALMLNAVRNSFVGDTGIFRQNFGSALSMSFLRFSEFHSLSDDDDVACLLNRIKIAKDIR